MRGEEKVGSKGMGGGGNSLVRVRFFTTSVGAFTSSERSVRDVSDSPGGHS